MAKDLKILVNHTKIFVIPFVLHVCDTLCNYYHDMEQIVTRKQKTSRVDMRKPSAQ